MRAVLLGFVGIAALSAPAAAVAEAPDGVSATQAFRSAPAGHAARDGVRVHRRDPRRDGFSDFRRDDDRDRRRDRGDVYFAYRDYQGDTLFRSDGFNDWWHDQPHRAYPAWMARNRNCEREYWSGGGWRC